MKRTGRYVFLAALLAFFLAADLLTAAVIQPFFLRCGRFYLSDFEIVRRDHPEKVWDKVFYGNSVVISGFREEESSSGYLNLGLDCGNVSDLWDILRKGEMTVGSELVIGLNSLTLYDDMDTNPLYPWHRAWYEPYCFFQRSRLKQLFEETVRQYLRGAAPAYPYLGQRKGVYYGAMTEAEIRAHRATEHYLPLLELTQDDFRENFRALEKITAYCAKKNIRLRLVWLPGNPMIAEDPASGRARELSEQFASAHGVELYDMTGLLPSDCFYDGGHFNYQYGSHIFTEVIDQWLNG